MWLWRNGKAERIAHDIRHEIHVDAVSPSGLVVGTTFDPATGASTVFAWSARTGSIVDGVPDMGAWDGMLREHDAIVNGLSLPYSSGAVEGAVTRAKAIKRAYCGRANLDLLRKRILQPS